MDDHRRRKTPRLRSFDYSSSGSYFITICTKDREHLFGEIVDGEMFLSEWGRIANDEISATNQHRQDAGITITHFVVMPNHVHLLIQIVGTQRAVSDWQRFEDFSKPTKCSVPSVVRSYKAAVTKSIREFANGHGKPCPYEVWQSRYYDHIIRGEQDYDMIVRYIAENPSKWHDDRFNNTQ